MKAKNDAIRDAEKIGIVHSNNIDDFEIESKMEIPFDVHTNVNSNEIENNENDNDIDDDYYSENDADQTAFTTVLDDTGEKRLVRKSYLVWSLTDPHAKLSKDRLRRFKSVPQKRKGCHSAKSECQPDITKKAQKTSQ